MVALLASGCGSASDDGPRGPLDLNIQVTGLPNSDAMIDELDARGTVATLWLGSGEIGP